jgi:hypothetical protein
VTLKNIHRRPREMDFSGIDMPDLRYLPASIPLRTLSIVNVNSVYITHRLHTTVAGYPSASLVGVGPLNAIPWAIRSMAIAHLRKNGYTIFAVTIERTMIIHYESIPLIA